MRQSRGRVKLLTTKELGHEVETYVSSHGIGRDFIDRESERLARSWGLGYSSRKLS